MIFKIPLFQEHNLTMALRKSLQSVVVDGRMRDGVTLVISPPWLIAGPD